MFHYEIFQINKNTEGFEYMFFDYDIALEKGFDLNLHYKKVYEGEVEANSKEEALEELFTIFNIDKPSDYHGRSMSVSDIVKLDNEFYYCNSFGWKLIDK